MAFVGDLIGKKASFYLQRTYMEAHQWHSTEEWIMTGVIRGVDEGTWFVQVERGARAKPGDLLRIKMVAKEHTIRVSMTDHPEVQ